MTPTPEQLAAADAIDPKKYEGHTPGPWKRSAASGGIMTGHTVFMAVHHYAYEELPPDDPEPDNDLVLDACLIPTLIHQRDEARDHLRVEIHNAAGERARAENLAERLDKAIIAACLYRSWLGEAADHRPDAERDVAEADCLFHGAWEEEPADGKD